MLKEKKISIFTNIPNELEYKNLVLECKNVYNCKPNELSSLIEKKQKTVDKKLVEAESSLKTVKENLKDNDKS